MHDFCYILRIFDSSKYCCCWFSYLENKQIRITYIRCSIKKIIICSYTIYHENIPGTELCIVPAGPKKSSKNLPTPIYDEKENRKKRLRDRVTVFAAFDSTIKKTIRDQVLFSQRDDDAGKFSVGLFFGLSWPIQELIAILKESPKLDTTSSRQRLYWL